MKIAILHYHLNTGGVTTVIRQQVDVLRHDHDVMVITGEAFESKFPVTTVTLQGLGYNRSLTSEDTPERTADAVIKAIHDEFDGPCDILHVHNPLLAKNKNLLKILNLLQQAGIHLFLQIHDLAEDGRPQAYYSEDEYPCNCHYGVINSRDFKALKTAGLLEQGLHRIDNIIEPYPEGNAAHKLENFILYPVRAIRRKNIGEAILLSCFFAGNEILMITQPPNSKDDLESYDAWKTFAKKNCLNVKFDAGLEFDYMELVRWAKYMITTSISEGFGFSFLEPWTAGKGLLGRKLPEICTDFESRKLNLDHLYSEMKIPLDWIEIPEFKKKWTDAYQKAHEIFGHSFSALESNNKFDQMTGKGNIDFGLLDEKHQEKVIARILSNDRVKNKLARMNPHLSKNSAAILDKDLIEKNKHAVLKKYNKNKYSSRLMDIYEKVFYKAVYHKIDKSLLFSDLMNNSRFSLLKWSPYAG